MMMLILRPFDIDRSSMALRLGTAGLKLESRLRFDIISGAVEQLARAGCVQIFLQTDA